MGLFDSRLFSWLRPAPPVTAEPARHRTHRRAIAGGRLSLDKGSSDYFGSFAVITPPDAEYDWRTLNLDSSTLDTLSPARLLELMVDLSPEVSNGLWNFLRLCNPGYEFTAVSPGSDVENERAKTAVQSFLDTLSDYYGSFDVVLGRLFIGAFLRGAFMAELVLDEAGREPADFATPDPISARFRKIRDEVRGTVWQLGQYQLSGWVALDRPTIRYVPIDPLPGSPYGRPLISPALHTSLFLLGLLHDLRRVVSQQGYPRLDLSVDFEALASIAPPEAQPGSQDFDDWVQAVMNEIDTVYSALEPDDAYVHSSVIAVNRPVGTVSGDMLGGIDALITALERMAARGLKTMPLLMGINDSTTETNANRQWELQAAAIKSLQHLAETMLERLLGLALEAQGIAAEVEFRFAELRAAELLRDAQTEALQIANERAKYEAGWTSQDEAAQAITGHAADAPEPRTSAGGFNPPMLDDGDGEERAKLLAEIRAARTAVEGLLSDATFSTNGYHVEETVY